MVGERRHCMQDSIPCEYHLIPSKYNVYYIHPSIEESPQASGSSQNQITTPARGRGPPSAPIPNRRLRVRMQCRTPPPNIATPFQKPTPSISNTNQQTRAAHGHYQQTRARHTRQRPASPPPRPSDVCKHPFHSFLCFWTALGEI